MTERHPKKKKTSRTDRKQSGHDNIGTLPITDEVGSEGGSYAEATMQRATRTGDAPIATGAAPAAQVSEEIVPGPDEPEDGIRSPRRGGTTAGSEQEDS